jgi:hypothetical protein
VDRIVAFRFGRTYRRIALPLADVVGLLGCPAALWLSLQPGVGAGVESAFRALHGHVPFWVVIAAAAILMFGPLCWILWNLLRALGSGGATALLVRQGWILPSEDANDSADDLHITDAGVVPRGAH